MNKEITVEEYINYYIKNACCYCSHYNPFMGVCGVEVLPIEKAILKNLDDRGCCDDIKKIAEQLKEKKIKNTMQFPTKIMTRFTQMVAKGYEHKDKIHVL